MIGEPKTYQQILDRITEVQLLLSQLRVDTEDLKICVGATAHYEEVSYLMRVDTLLRGEKFTEELRSNVLLSKYWLEWKKARNYKVNKAVLKETKCPA